MPEESYIIRIYRRVDAADVMTDKSADDIAGTVKDVEEGVWKPFYNKDELWRIIMGKH